MENPFTLELQDENFFDEETWSKIDTAAQTIDSRRGAIVIVVGEYGSGRSTIIKEILTRCKAKPFFIAGNYLDQVRLIPNEAVEGNMVAVIENAELLEGRLLKKIIEFVEKLSIAGVNFIIEMTPEKLVDWLTDHIKKNSVIIKVPKLTLEEAKKLLITRLNKVREPSPSLEPFSEEEVKMLWEKSKGNPKLFLMLAGAIYEAKVKS